MRSASDPTGLQSKERRHSAVADLDRCLSLVSVLGDRVDKATAFIKNMTGTCKGCHGQTGSEHAGSRWGFEHCTLEHSSDCGGGVEEIPGKKRGCPDSYQPRATLSGNETEVSQQRYSDLDDDDDDSDSDTEAKTPSISKTLPGLLSGNAPLLSNPLLSGMTQTSAAFGVGTSSLLTALQGAAAMSAPLMSSGQGVTGVDSNSLLLGAGNLLQPKQDQQQALLLQQVLQQQLLQQQQQAAMLQENQRVVQEMKDAVLEAQKAARSAASVRRKTSVSFSDNLRSEAELLKDTNKKVVTKPGGDGGIDMNAIRNIPGLRDKVEDVMDKQVYTHASLSRTPSAVSSVPPVQVSQPDSPSTRVIAELRAQLAEQQKSIDCLVGAKKPETNKSERRAARKVEAQAAAARADAERKEARERLVAARASAKQAKRAAQKLGVLGLSSSSDSGTESDDELDLDQTLKKNKVLKKKKLLTPTHLGDSSEGDEPLQVVTDRAGRAFKVVDGKLEPLPTYVKDPNSGKLVRTTPAGAKLSSSDTSDSSDEQVVRRKEKKARQKARKAGGRAKSEAKVLEERSALRGITPLVAHKQQLPPVPYLQDSKGKSHGNKDQNTSLSVVEWAKMCPIKYAPTCNSKNLNLPVFMWARLAEVRALSAGALETSLKPGELDARLRHLQCVLELVGTNSVLSEYAGYGWQLGRDYDRKVQATMDNGASDWVSFNSMFSLGPHPSFVLSAKDEVEKVTKKSFNTRDEDPAKLKKKVCGRVNSCKTAKRCEWELENPNTGRCKRLHQCSYCKATQNKNVFHQAWDCPAGGKEAVASGSHSL